MSKTLTVGGPGKGIFPARVTATFTLQSTAISAGDVVQLDLAAVNTEIDNVNEGAVNSIWTTVTDPVAASALTSLTAGIFALALEDVADGADGLFLLQGVASANVTGSVLEGSLLIGTTGNVLGLAGTSGSKIIAISLGIDASDVVDVWFDGLDGFGQMVES